MVLELFKSHYRPVRVFLSEDADFDKSVCPVETVVVSRDVFAKLTDEKTPQGVLCVAEIPKRELRSPKGKCLLLDGVSDPGNMGAILRTANACGYDEIYLTDDCTDPYSPKSVRASMSGVFYPDLYFGRREEILSVLKSVPVYVADLDGENVFTFTPQEKFALVIGNEANGVSKTVKDAADKKINIPMSRNQESLNAAVAASVCMYLLKKDEFSK